ASLTGHLLFTSLHTNSAVGAIARLLDMGMEPYLVASSLTAVLAQRLARQVCPSCKAPYAPGPEVRKQMEELAARAKVQLPAGSLDRLVMGKGCDKCRRTGYSGRVLIMELLPMSQALRGLVLQKASMGELQKVAESEGMVNLLADGVRKVLAGRTTLVEVLRVVSV
ncbi:GspE/PulE family protein, partial [Elusimicrobiota bacterium]